MLGIKTSGRGAAEMAQWLSALTPLAVGPDPVPSTYKVTPIPGYPAPSSDLFRHPVHMWYAYIHPGKTLIQIKYQIVQGCAPVKNAGPLPWCHLTYPGDLSLRVVQTFNLQHEEQRDCHFNLLLFKENF